MADDQRGITVPIQAQLVNSLGEPGTASGGQLGASDLSSDCWLDGENSESTASTAAQIQRGQQYCHAARAPIEGRQDRGELLVGSGANGKARQLTAANSFVGSVAE